MPARGYFIVWEGFASYLLRTFLKKCAVNTAEVRFKGELLIVQAPFAPYPQVISVSGFYLAPSKKMIYSCINPLRRKNLGPVTHEVHIP